MTQVCLGAFRLSSFDAIAAPKSRQPYLARRPARALRRPPHFLSTGFCYNPFDTELSPLHEPDLTVSGWKLLRPRPCIRVTGRNPERPNLEALGG